MKLIRSHVRCLTDIPDCVQRTRIQGQQPPPDQFGIATKETATDGVATGNQRPHRNERSNRCWILKELVRELIKKGCHRGGLETDADNAVIKAINQRDGDIADRKRKLVDWLRSYSVFMGFSTDSRIAIAGQIIAFADERQGKSLHLDKVQIISEFNKLKDRISTVTDRDTTSLTSKALWCCYPDDVPIFDRNAACALKIISRLCHLAPGADQRKYACFVNVWFQVYSEVEPVIDGEDLTDCPYRIRVLDRLLWYLGQNTFYNETADLSAS